MYVDVGANHPTIGSQTYHLEQLGWSGLLIEPIPDNCELLRKSRAGKVVECACSSPENNDRQLQLILAGAGSTFNPELLLKSARDLKTIAVKCKTLDSVLGENNVPVGFHFLSIDVEGHEMDVFRGFTLTKWKPQLILLEDHVLTHEKHDYMRTNGYQLILRTGFNSWYVPATEKYDFSISAKLEYFRKYWLGLLPRKFRFRR